MFSIAKKRVILLKNVSMQHYDCWDNNFLQWMSVVHAVMEYALSMKLMSVPRIAGIAVVMVSVNIRRLLHAVRLQQRSVLFAEMTAPTPVANGPTHSVT